MQQWQEFQNAPFALICFNSAFELIWANSAASDLDSKLTPGIDVRSVFSVLKSEYSTKWFESGSGKFSLHAETSSGEYVFLQAWRTLNREDLYFASITKEPAKSLLGMQREILAEATDQAWESICITDADLDLPGPRFLYVNKAYEELFGFTEAEVLGKTPRIHQGLLTDKSVLKRLKSNLQAGQEFHGETINYRKNGQPFWLEWKICPVRNEFGVINRFISFQRDVTKLKEARQRLDDFHSTLSHELRAPLASVLGSLKLMQSFHPPESEKAKRLLSIALLCSERLVKLLNDLLDLSKLEAGKVELNKTLVRISDLLADAAASVETYQLEKKVRIEIASLNAEVYVDKDRIIQVLINLFSNALKFSPTNGIIHVTARRTRDQTIRFSVRDEGPGISKENQLKLFGKFEQLVPEDGIDRVGSGLGLAIVKALVTQHEGKIGVHSIVGQGAEFWFEVQEAKSQKLLRTSGSDFKPLK